VIFQWEFRHRDGKTIALSGDGLYILLTARSFAEMSAQGGDVDGEVGIFDKTVGPDLTHQLLFGGEAAAVLHQDQENFKSFRCERNRTPITFQQVIFRVEAKSGELIQVIDLQRAYLIWKSFGNSLENS
jgi:hypothetical protein